MHMLCSAYCSEVIPGKITSRTEDPVRRRSLQIALAFRFVTRPAHSVGGYLCEGSVCASRSASLGNVSISSLGRVGRLSSTGLGGLSVFWTASHRSLGDCASCEHVLGVFVARVEVRKA